MSSHIFKLPTEIVKYIFDQIDSSFFHQDLGRLTVSKQWFEFAHPACLRSIRLSQQTLRTLVASRANVGEGSQPLKYSLEVLELEIGGYPPRERMPVSHDLETAASHEPQRATPAEKKALRDDIMQLAHFVQGSQKLRTLRVRSWDGDLLFYPDNLVTENTEHLSLPVIGPFFSVENLSVVVLDIPWTSLRSSPHSDNHDHLCPAISTTLGTLRTLHLRLYRICPECIKPQNPEDDLRLRTLVVNMSLVTKFPGVTAEGHSKRCGSQAEEQSLLQLKADLQEQLGALAKQMTAPKIVRLLTHTPPRKHLELQSYDVLTGKTMILDHGMAWDEDGEVLDDDDGLPGSQDELSDYFATYLDDSDSS